MAGALTAGAGVTWRAPFGTLRRAVVQWMQRVVRGNTASLWQRPGNER